MVIVKVTFIGDTLVGKTSLLIRHTKGTFSIISSPTIGSGSVSSTIKIGNESITIQYWDTAGQERFQSLLPMYSRGSNIGVFVYSVTSRSSFNNVEKWVSLFKDSADMEAKCVLIGNKMDLDNEREVSFEEGQLFAQTNHMSFFEVSAKTGENVNVAFSQIIAFSTQDTAIVDTVQPLQEAKASGCC